MGPSPNVLGCDEHVRPGGLVRSHIRLRSDRDRKSPSEASTGSMNFLNNHIGRVRYNNCYSKFRSLKTSLPQGGVVWLHSV
ncbi:hypothetical protein CDAR_615441 [Caerostris darwini]|uniref:Uncharacterized protein n=1 Tax=Caerostris darwini TaxID=1538125 RepID=A0AAV4RXG4_9ARAC|nr:hypothetical protein CDAR_615441 [Caerostris darwini]